MFPKKETLEIEFKSDSKNLDDVIIVEEAVALANTNGGKLFIGIEDDGSITGARANHLKTYRIAALIASRTVPSLTVSCEQIDGVLIVNVPKSASVVATTKGRVLKRRLKADGTPESAPMYPFELSTRLSDLGKLDFTAQPIPEASIDDFDEIELKRLKALINNRNGSDKYLLELSDEDLLKTLRMAVEYEGRLTPTVCGLILAGKQDSIEKYVPTSKSSLQVLDGTSIRVNKDFNSGLLHVIEQISSGISAWNPVTELEYGLIREPVPLYNENSIREALVNAFGHRDYSILKRVIVRINDMGMAISNPGSFIEGVTIKNLLTVEPHGRNPALMDALKRIRLAERTGRGIDRIYEGSLLYGRPIPDYSDSDNYQVSVFFPAVKPDVAFCKMIADERSRTQKPLPISTLLILSLIKQYRRLSLGDFRDLTSLNQSIVKLTLESLVESGLVERTGGHNSHVYILSAEIYKQAGKEKEYVRQRDIDKVRRPEMIMQLLNQSGRITVSDVSQLLHLTKEEAYYEIRKLKKEGKILNASRGRNAYYIAAKD